MLERQQREGQGATRPREAVSEIDRYMYDLNGVSVHSPSIRQAGFALSPG